MRPSLPITTATVVAATALSASAISATSVLARSGEDRATSPRPSTYTMPGDAVYPEGIARDPRGKAFYVTSTTDGTVFRGDVRRAAMTPLAAPGVDGRTTAVGIKVDRHRRLVVAGGATGKVFVLDARTGRTISALDTRPGETPAFLNDVALTSRGVGYVTDSQRPTLYRVTLPKPVRAKGGRRERPARTTGTPRIEPFLSFEGTAFDYEEGFNANGIVAARGGRILLVVQSNTGELFRVDTRTKDVSQVDLGGQTLTNGDGLLLKGRTLYVVRNRQELVVPVRMSGDLRSGRVGTGATSDALKYPTTVAADGGRLLAVNSQFDRRSAGAAPDLPFTVVAIPRPRTPSGD